MAMFIVKPWYRKKDDAIYGAEWAGGSDPSWVRTDAAVGFSNPNPYYSGMSTTPSSPFDNIMPWAGMRRVTDSNAGELVEIPKFYYKWTRDGVKMKLQISMYKHDGFLTSPAHADRGDGVGERDYVYVGRYQCANTNYKSLSGVNPKGAITRATGRTNIHNLGNNIWQWDFSTLFTIQMLYLVEYATWDCQRAISYGCYSNSSTGTSVVACGGTDNMPYHTGTMAPSRTTYTDYMQYRYIEGLWSNSESFVDGMTTGTYGMGYNSSTQGGFYLITNPSQFTDNNAVGEYIGITAPQSTAAHTNVTANIKSYLDTNKGLIPKEAVTDDNYATYGCANVRVAGGTSFPKHGHVLIVGGGTSQWLGGGLFSWGADVPYEGWTYNTVGCRLMVLPPSRLSA